MAITTKTLLILLICSINRSIAVDISCTFLTGIAADWKLGISLYYCKLNADPAIQQPEMTVDSAIGNHQTQKNNTDVKAFHTQTCASYQINYFPRGLATIFPNLIVIDLNCVKLKEIHQSDLKDFPGLRVLDLFQNEIEVIEKDLFAFNTELEVVWLQENKIYEIYPGVFDKLIKLKYLYLRNNVCVSAEAANSVTETKKFALSLNEKCYNADAKIMDGVKTLELSQRDLSEKMMKVVSALENSTNVEKDAGDDVGKVVLEIGKKVEENKVILEAINGGMVEDRDKMTVVEDKVHNLTAMLSKLSEDLSKIDTGTVIKSVRKEMKDSHDEINQNLLSIARIQDVKFEEVLAKVTEEVTQVKTIEQSAQESHAKEVNCSNEKVSFVGFLIILILAISNVIVTLMLYRQRSRAEGNVVHEFEMPKFTQ